MQTTNKRDDVVQAAMEIIAQEGFHNAPTSLIAKRANVGMGTIYRYFKSKDELIREIYNERVSLAKKHALADYDTTGPTKDRYLKLCRNFFNYMVSNPLDYGFFEQYRNSPYGVKEQFKIVSAFVNEETSDDYPMLKLFSEGQESKVIKDIKLPLLIAVTMDHIYTLARHQIYGEVEIKDKEVEQFFNASWEAISQ